MTWVGIDYDTHAVHLVRLEVIDVTSFAEPQVQAVYGPATYHPVQLEGDDAFERMRHVSWEMPGEGFWEHVTGAAIEEPGGKYSVAKLKGVQGAIVTSLPADLLVAPYHAAKWKSLVGLGGNASKDQVRAWVYEQLGENPQWPQDACDAYCLARVIAEQTVPA